MRTFQTFLEDAWGTGNDQQVLSQVDGKVRELESHITMLVDKLSHGDGPVAHAANRFFRQWDILKKTIQQAELTNKENPEVADHPPQTMSFNNS